MSVWARDSQVPLAVSRPAAIELIARSREPGGAAGWISLDGYLAAGRTTAAPDVGSPELPCAIVYTAGSTVTPKGGGAF